MNIAILMFFVCALLAVAGAVVLILAHEPIHSALALVLVMMALAVLYLLLGAPFIAAVQVIVYAGAVMVLFVFVIMLLNAGVEERTDFSKIAKFAGGLRIRPSARRSQTAWAPQMKRPTPQTSPRCFSGSICSRLRRPRS
jgi:NADH:ubiquinone oxidoreductase subunit 6 (subunit J)